jgi:hypothetical protein
VGRPFISTETQPRLTTYLLTSLILPSIVIIHGLQGHPYKTWASTTAQGIAIRTSSQPEETRSKRKKLFHRIVPVFGPKSPNKPASEGQNESSTAKPAEHGPVKTTSVFWPADLLPTKLPNSRILMFGYDTKVTKFMASATNKNSILSHSKDLLFALRRERVLNRPLIFVAHSLGGIVLKEVR